MRGLWAIFLAGCMGVAPQTPPVRPPSVLLVTLDTTRADHLGAYGFAAAHTPNLDQLAAEGARFAQHVTVAPLTLPAHTSLLSGLTPAAHGVRDNGDYVVPPGVETLAERLKAAGYETHAFVSAAVLDSRYGLDQGFDTYDDDLWAEDTPKLFMIRDRPASRTVDRVLAWLRSWSDGGGDAPFFAWVHLFDPHEPHEALSLDRDLSASPYDAEITAVDRAVGRLLKGLVDAGVAEDTLVIVTADHGESLGEHGEKTHGVFVYEATMHVPLLLRFPGVAPGTVVQAPTSAVDVMPTVLDLLGLPSADTQGADLVPALRGQRLGARALYSESLLSQLSFGMAPLRAVRVGDQKWVRAPRPERYDLSSDPGETTNLAGQETALDDRLDAALQGILDDSGRRALPTVVAPVDDATRELFMALGYLPAQPGEPPPAPLDPKDGLGLYQAQEDARHLAQQGQWKASGEAVRALLDRVPDNVTGRNMLALSLLRQGQLDQARAEYERSLATLPDQERVYSVLGQIASRQGRTADARAAYDRALSLSPAFVEVMVHRAALEYRAGDKVAAERWLRRAVALDPTAQNAALFWADFQFLEGHFSDALAWYQKVIAALPTHYVATLQAGLAAQRMGDVAAAERYYALAESLRPDDWKPTYNRACLRALAGDTEGAFALLERAGGAARVGATAAADADLSALHRDPRWPDYAARRP